MKQTPRSPRAGAKNRAVAKTDLEVSRDKINAVTRSLGRKSQSLKEQLDKTQAGFVMTELHTSITFATVALEADNLEKKERNAKNARTGFDTALHFSHTAELDRSKGSEYQEKLEVLKGLLRQLGEEV
jgi:hypothetical protein